MDFFEALRKRVYKRLDLLDAIAGFETEKYGAVDATIEALKEMVVGEPVKRVIETDGKNHTWIMNKDREVTLHFLGVHGTDGEEVTAMVFRVVR